MPNIYIDITRFLDSAQMTLERAKSRISFAFPHEKLSALCKLLDFFIFSANNGNY